MADPVVPPSRTCEHGKTYGHPLWNGPFGSPLSQIVDSCPGPVVPLPEPDEHDGFTVHPDLTPRLERHLRLLVAELGVCCRDHYEDERLARVEANVRWLLGERI